MHAFFTLPVGTINFAKRYSIRQPTTLQINRFFVESLFTQEWCRKLLPRVIIAFSSLVSKAILHITRRHYKLLPTATREPTTLQVNRFFIEVYRDNLENLKI
jgi:hypothetical protein